MKCESIQVIRKIHIAQVIVPARHSKTHESIINNTTINQDSHKIKIHILQIVMVSSYHIKLSSVVRIYHQNHRYSINQNKMPIDEDYDFLFKTVIVGDTHVGKTQILSRFILNNFSHASKPTIGVEFGTKTTNVAGVFVKNQIWDTAGQQKFRALTCAYYRGAVGAIVVFDLSKSITFEHVTRWIKEVKEYSEPGVSILLVGNKNDLENHEIRQQEIQNYASENQLIYLSTSAATGENVELAFETLVKQILGHVKPNEHYLEDTEDDPSLVQNLQGHTQNGKSPKKSVQSLSTEVDQKPKPIKREKPRIQAFSIENPNNSIKINTQEAKDEKKKKNCC